MDEGQGYAKGGSIPADLGLMTDWGPSHVFPTGYSRKHELQAIPGRSPGPGAERPRGTTDHGDAAGESGRERFYYRIKRIYRGAQLLGEEIKPQ